MTILHHFAGGTEDGSQSFAPLVFDPDGNLYGITRLGGKFGNGTVFRLDTAGNVTILHSFEQELFDFGPMAGLYRGRAGNLFGVTSQGGQFNLGVIFEVAADGRYSVLHEFAGPFVYPPDGAHPIGGLFRDSAANFYGTTMDNGKNFAGVVFELDAAGNYSVLYNFTGTHGAYPLGTLIADRDDLIGTAEEGGTVFSACQPFDQNEFPGCGVVYKLSKDGTKFGTRSLNLSTGRYPQAGVVSDALGNLYGTTYLGGTAGFGAVFKMDNHGSFTTLHMFTGTNGDGAHAYSGVVMDAAGNLYGTTRSGGDAEGDSGDGVIYRITP